MMYKIILILALCGIFRSKALFPSMGKGKGTKKSNKGKKAFFVADLSRGKKHTDYTHG